MNNSIKIGVFGIALLFLMNLISASSYDDCSIYGNCQPVSAGTTKIINSGNTTNFTNYWTTDTSQSGLTGNKQGSFYINSTGQGTFDSLVTTSLSGVTTQAIYTDGFYGEIYANNGTYTCLYKSIDWQNGYANYKKLNCAFGTPVYRSIDWQNGILYDKTQTLSVNYTGRLLSGNWTKDGTALCLSNGTNCGGVSTYNSTYAGYSTNVSRNWTLDTYTNWNTDWLSTYNVTYEGYSINVSTNWTLNGKSIYTNFSSFNSTQMSYSDGYISILVSWLNGAWCSLTGCTMSGNLNMGTQNITNMTFIKLNNIGSKPCDLSVLGSICKNSTGTYIIG